MHSLERKRLYFVQIHWILFLMVQAIIKSLLLQAMAWHQHMASYYLTMKVRSLEYIYITRLQCVKCSVTVHFNTLKPRQKWQNFADDIFKRVFLKENVWIAIEFSLKFVPKGPINNIPALVQIMAWRRPGDKPSSEPMMVSLRTHICVAPPQWVNKNRQAWKRNYILYYSTYMITYPHTFYALAINISFIIMSSLLQCCSDYITSIHKDDLHLI